MNSLNATAMTEDLEDLKTEIVGRLRDAALRAQDARFDRAATALDHLPDARAWSRAREDLTAPMVAAGLRPADAATLVRALHAAEMT